MSALYYIAPIQDCYKKAAEMLAKCADAKAKYHACTITQYPPKVTAAGDSVAKLTCKYKQVKDNLSDDARHMMVLSIKEADTDLEDLKQR